MISMTATQSRLCAYTLAAMAVVATALPNAATAGDDNMICAEHGQLAWSLPITPEDVGKSPAQFFGQPELGLQGGVIDLGRRLEIAIGPENKPSLKSNVPRGENKRWSVEFDAFDGPGIRHACLTLQVYLTDRFDFGSAKTKLAWGLWGGQPKMSAGGVPPEMQQGWTVRNATNGRHGSKIYSYHLNRDKPRVDRARCEPYGCMFGKTTPGSGPLPAGRWFDIQLEVKMNDPGEANGYARYWVDDQIASEMTGMVYSQDGDWLVQGLKLTDMWGGNTAASSNHSPRYQSIWYSDYRIYDMAAERRVASAASGAGSTQADRPVPLSPASEQPPGAVEFVWTQGSDVDSYQIKLIDAELATILYKRLTPTQADCGFEPGKCRLAGPELADGSYKWRLRHESGGKRQEYTDMRFSVGSVEAEAIAAEEPAVVSRLAQMAPLGEIEREAVRFVWSPASDVDGYDLKIVDRASRQTRLYRTLTNAAASCTATQCEFRGPVLEPGRYQWSIRSVTNRQRSAYEKSDFVVVKPAPVVSALAPISPSGRISDKSPTLRWQPQTHADRYFVKIVASDGSIAFSGRLPASHCRSDQCSLEAPSLRAGSYQWMVRPVQSGIKSDYRKLRFRIR